MSRRAAGLRTSADPHQGRSGAASLPRRPHEDRSLWTRLRGLGDARPAWRASATRWSGVDTNEFKVDCLDRGESPIVEKDLPELIATGVARRAGSRATHDVSPKAMPDAELVLVCVGTPSARTASLDLSHVKRAAAEVGRGARAHPHRTVVVFRSTMLPGSVETRAGARARGRPRGCKAGKDFGVAYNPEFLREGTAVADFFGAAVHRSGRRRRRAQRRRAARALRARSRASWSSPAMRTAEMLKYVNNSFHALKVAFANEIGNLCKREGIDSHEVMALFCLRHAAQPLAPLPEARASPSAARACPRTCARSPSARARHDLELPVLESILRSNDLQRAIAPSQLHRAVCAGSRLGVLGLSFKAETDDLRESPIVRVVGTLVGKGYSAAAARRPTSTWSACSAPTARSSRTRCPYLPSGCPPRPARGGRGQRGGRGRERARRATATCRADARAGQTLVDLVRRSSATSVTPRGVPWPRLVARRPIATSSRREPDAAVRPARLDGVASALRAAGWQVSASSARPATPWTAPYEELDGIHIYRYPAPPPTQGCLVVRVGVPLLLAADAWLSLRGRARAAASTCIHAVQSAGHVLGVRGAFYKLFGEALRVRPARPVPRGLRRRASARTRLLVRAALRVLERLHLRAPRTW